MALRLYIGIFIVSLGISSACAQTVSPIPGFHAEYEVLRNGKALGHTTLDLQSINSTTWEFVNETRGTEGMAAMLGVDVIERSHFQWHNGLPQSIHYEFIQKASFSNKQRRIDFDWEHHTAHSSDAKHSWEIPLNDQSAMDRNMVLLALSADLTRHANQFVYSVADKDKLETKRYTQTANEVLHLPIGTIPALRLERQANGNNKRITSWYAPDKHYLPIQMEQEETNGDKITMRLTSIQIKNN